MVENRNMKIGSCYKNVSFKLCSTLKSFTKNQASSKSCCIFAKSLFNRRFSMFDTNNCYIARYCRLYSQPLNRNVIHKISYFESKYLRWYRLHLKLFIDFEKKNKFLIICMRLRGLTENITWWYLAFANISKSPLQIQHRRESFWCSKMSWQRKIPSFDSNCNEHYPFSLQLMLNAMIPNWSRLRLNWQQ